MYCKHTPSLNTPKKSRVHVHTHALSTLTATLETCGRVLVDHRLLDDPGLWSRAEGGGCNHHGLLLELRLERGPGLEEGGRARRGRGGCLGGFDGQVLELGGGGGQREGLDLHLAVPLRLRLQGPAAAATAAAAALEGATQVIRKQIWEVACLVTDELQHLCETEENVFSAILLPKH